MQKLKAVIFDNDGTIADTYDLILESFRYATREVLGNQLPDEMMMEKVGIPLAEQVKDFSDDPDVQKKLVDVYREHNHKVHDGMISIFPGELDAMRRLHAAGLKMGVVTSKMHALAYHGTGILGLNEYFDVFIGSDDCDKHKPDPAPVLMAVEQLGLEPSECAYVGDSPFDIMAGNAAGCVSVAVLWGMFTEAELRAQNPNIVCADFDELTSSLLTL